MLQFLFLCILFLTWPAVILIRHILFLRRTKGCTEQIEGRICRMEEKIPVFRRGRSEFTVDVEYIYQGQSYVDTAFTRFRYDDYCTDQFVNVYVDPKNPACFVLGSERDTARTNILIGVLVLFVLLIAVAALNVQILEEREQQEIRDKIAAEIAEKIRTGDTEDLMDQIEAGIIGW